MINRKLFGPALIAAVTIACQNASAAETVDVKAGQSVTWPIAIYNPTNCEYGPPPKVEFKQTENGKLSSKRGTYVVPKGAACAGKTFKGVFVTYAPKKGFRGSDCGSVSLVYPALVRGGNATSTRLSVCFNVK